MAQTYIGKPKKGQTVDHIDRKPFNNRIDNLRWATGKEQAENKNKRRRQVGIRLSCVDVATGEETEFISKKHAAESMSPLSSLSPKNIQHKLVQFIGKDKTFIGRKWSYIERNPVGEIRPLPSSPGQNVSSCGMVQNLHGRWSRGYVHDDYMCVNILSKLKRVHRLVMEAFIGPPPSDDTLVNHKNGNKLDNCVNNLEYSTPSENTIHAYEMGLMKTTRVLRICKDSGKVLQEHDSVKDALLSIGRPYSSAPHISKCCLGKAVTAYGFRWSYPGESQKYAHLVKPSKKILRICKDTGKILQEYLSINEATKFVGGDPAGHITRCCKRGRVSAHGYIWSYLGEESTHEYVARGKVVLRICKDTNEVLQRYESQTEAALFVNGKSCCISKCCQGKKKTAYGYKWRLA